MWLATLNSSSRKSLDFLVCPLWSYLSLLLSSHSSHLPSISPLHKLTIKTEIIDPWAGSYAMEALTAELEEKAKKVIEEVFTLKLSSSFYLPSVFFFCFFFRLNSESLLTFVAQVEALGGMAKAVTQGMPKRRIEESAAKRQANIDSANEGKLFSRPLPSSLFPLPSSLAPLSYSPLPFLCFRSRRLTLLQQ